MRRKNRPAFPTSPPPEHMPMYTASRSNVIPEVFFQYMNYNIYIWLHDGSGFWMFPTYIDDKHLSGYVWDGRWNPSRVEWRRIDSFY